MEFRKINLKNFYKVAKLKVADSQTDFVASNAYSIMEAFASREDGYVAQPFAIYDNDLLVGFIMFGFNLYDTEENDPLISKNNYCIWRLMIDEKYQNKGYGTLAMQTALDYLHTFPFGKAEYCWLSYEENNLVAKRLYNKFGFIENGETCEDEIVAVKKL